MPERSSPRPVPPALCTRLAIERPAGQERIRGVPRVEGYVFSVFFWRIAHSTMMRRIPAEVGKKGPPKFPFQSAEPDLSRRAQTQACVPRERRKKTRTPARSGTAMGFAACGRDAFQIEQSFTKKLFCHSRPTPRHRYLTDSVAARLTGKSVSTQRGHRPHPLIVQVLIARSIPGECKGLDPVPETDKVWSVG